MCDTYVPEAGYICFDCQDEFKNSLPLKRNFIWSDKMIKLSLLQFMKIDKSIYQKTHTADITDFFRNYTQ